MTQARLEWQFGSHAPVSSGWEANHISPHSLMTTGVFGLLLPGLQGTFSDLPDDQQAIAQHAAEHSMFLVQPVRGSASYKKLQTRRQ